MGINVTSTYICIHKNVNQFSIALHNMNMIARKYITACLLIALTGTKTRAVIRSKICDLTGMKNIPHARWENVRADEDFFPPFTTVAFLEFS